MTDTQTTEYNYSFMDRPYLPYRDVILGKRKPGRPKGSENVKSILTRILNKKHSSREGRETYSVLEWIILALKNEVEKKGNLRAIAIYDKYFGEFLDPVVENAGCGILLVPADLTREETWIWSKE